MQLMQCMYTKPIMSSRIQAAASTSACERTTRTADAIAEQRACALVRVEGKSGRRMGVCACAGGVDGTRRGSGCGERMGLGRMGWM